ncbi:M48 family metalloprotease [Actinophytocola sp.]|uniref:M48 family metalloprotease n=1 Tax=Actinophytocola sp. TaxID=1872138 RepID=UPI002D52D68A|nr:M48 family metalloprotease [Actinophytocola sp.]HYQ63658.1 M48 family metalloprotease [Actinophytocola sp.]
MYEPVVPEQNPKPPAIRRLPDASSWLTASLKLPAFLSSLVVMSLLGTLVLPSASWVLPVLWILSGVVLFVPAVESAVSLMSLHLSRPGHAELTVLVPAWQAVCRSAGVNGSKYVLLVEESDQPNAMAAGGRTVAVSRAALRLPPAELAAVLAHELGHHLSAHAVVYRLAWWYALPSRAAAFLGGVAIRFVLAVGRVFLAFGNGLAALAALFLSLILLTAIAFVSFWLLIAPLIAPLLAWSSRLGEYQADRTAAQLGYGPGLIRAFRRWQYAEAGDLHAAGLKARLLSTHPSLADRIRRLETIQTLR